MKKATISFIVLFAVTGLAIIYLDANDDQACVKDFLDKYKSPLFGFHMACWMLLGMMANYYWDLLNAGKEFSDAKLSELLLPILVSPIVFYVVWSIWGSDDQSIKFAWNLVAFQNGFFWQVVLSKSAPFSAGEAPNKSSKKDSQSSRTSS